MQGHLHKILGPWLQEHTDVRDAFVRQRELPLPLCREIVERLEAAIEAVGRDHPVPKLSQRKLDRMAKEAAVAAAVAEQAREVAGLAGLQADGAAVPAQAGDAGGAAVPVQSDGGARPDKAGRGGDDAVCAAVRAAGGAGAAHAANTEGQEGMGGSTAEAGAGQMTSLVGETAAGHDRQGGQAGDVVLSGADPPPATVQQPSEAMLNSIASEEGANGGAAAVARPAKQARIQSACV